MGQFWLCDVCDRSPTEFRALEPADDDTDFTFVLDWDDTLPLGIK